MTQYKLNKPHLALPTFGSLKNGRNFSVGSGYRFGMNTQQKDDEIFVGAYTAEFWEYDSRLGRRWNLDPKPNDLESQYSTFLNNPICNIDIKGDFVIKGSTEGSNRTERKQNRQEKSALRFLAKEMRKFTRTWDEKGWGEIKTITGMSKREYKKMLKNGKGPSLSFTNINQRGSGLMNGDNAGNSTADSRYAQTEIDGNSITLDEGFYTIYKDLKNYKNTGQLTGSLTHPNKDFGPIMKSMGVDGKEYFRLENTMFIQFAVVTLGHELAHAGAGQKFPPLIAGAVERGRMHENYFHGSVSGHGNYGYSIYRTFESRSDLPENRQSNLELQQKLTQFWNDNYGQ